MPIGYDIKPRIVPKEADVLIIGAGANGLEAGAYLAKVLVALQKSRKRRSWLPVIWALGKSIHCRHFFKEQISVLLPEQDVTG